jgi:hypothetical protein
MGNLAKTDVSKLVKDIDTGIILPIDIKNGLQAAKEKKQKYLDQQSKIDEIDDIKKDVSDIKQMLEQLLKTQQVIDKR